MRSPFLLSLVFVLGCAFSGQAAASENAECRAGGSSCAELVYRGFTYPYRREAGSYLYVNGGIYPYQSVTGDLVGDSTVRLPDGSVMAAGDLLKDLGLQPRSQAQLNPVIGYGSNPAPSQLDRKFQADDFDGDVVIPVMKGFLKDFDVVWTPVFVSYGAMPATVAPSPGTTVDVWVTWLDDRARKVMDASEHTDPGNYPLYVSSTLQGAVYDFDGPDPEGFSIYVSCFGALTRDGTIYAVASVPALDRHHEPISGPEAMKSVLPVLGGPDTVLELLSSNVMDPELRAGRNMALRPLGALPDIPGASGLEACRQSRSGPAKAY